MSHILKSNLDEPIELGDPVTVEIYRFDPSRDSRPKMQRYVVPYYHRMSVFTLLREIYEHIDPTLAFRNQQCGRGLCGTCQMRIGVNNKVVKSCAKTVEPGSYIVIRPFNEKKVIRDLVVNL
jgi:succinate dehydrogenase / fumarate reductase iron-sulfur subunit